MSWYPPWSYKERTEWGRSRPFLAGFYFGLWMALPVGAFLGVTLGMATGLVGGGLTWIAAWPFFGVMLKRRVGLRPDSEYEIATTFRKGIKRPWIAASDRWVTVAMWFFVIGFVVSALAMISGVYPRTVGTIVTLGLDALFGASLWAERKRRNRQSPTS